MREARGGKPGLTIGLCGNWNHIRVGRRVIRALGDPDCICLRVNQKMDTIALLPCTNTDPMSYRVPDEFFTDARVMFRIYCKNFVKEFLSVNGLDPDRSYILPGNLVEQKNAAFFSVSDYPQFIATPSRRRETVGNGAKKKKV